MCLIVITAIANIATAVGVVIGAIQLYRSVQQERTEFEDDLSKEYRQIALQLPLDALVGNQLSPEQQKTSAIHFFHYFDLCNEQVFLWSKDRICGETWKLWCDGIKSNMGRPAFKQAWAEIKSSIDAAGGSDFRELRDLEARNFRSDPLE